MNKTCVYCTQEGVSKTGDHLFARNFFLERRRANLPQVPACEVCNGEKSKLEHYLTAVLPFGGRHEDANENLSTMVPSRLRKNKKLHSELIEHSQEISIQDDSGLIVKHTAIPFAYKNMEKLLAYTVRGLAWFYFETLIPKDYFVGVMVPRSEYSAGFSALFTLETEKRVQKSLGNGTILVEGVQSESEPYLTQWKICFYEGLTQINLKSQQQGALWYYGLSMPDQPDWWPKQ